MEHTQFNQNEATVLEQYKKARIDMRSGKNEEIEQAKAVFLRLGDYRNCADLAQKCEMMLTFQLGNTVSFGAYRGESIRWKVVEQRGKMRMLLAQDIVFEMPYNELRTDVSWQTTTLRKWLNHDFLKETLTDAQRPLVISTRRTNEPNEQFFTNAGLTTMDKVFILSKRELDIYLPEAQDRALGKWWWLRTPGDNLLAAEAVDADGSVYLHGININYAQGGVRPAMWVLLRDY